MSEHDESLDGFLRREHRRLVGALSLYCGNAEVAEELAQEALYRACRQWAEVGSMASPGAWVHRVGINLANSTYRRRKAEWRANRRSAQSDSALSADLDQAAVLAVRQAVAALPARQRAALVLRHYGGYSGVEIAELLGVTEGAVKQLTHRAITSLRTQLPDYSHLLEVPDAH